MNMNMLSAPLSEAPDMQSCATDHEELEKAIAEVWQEVFHLPHIDRDANFFELGGNSLLGMDLTELLAARLDIEVPVVMLFQYPSIRELTAIIAAA